jgi:hypothetical protein
VNELDEIMSGDSVAAPVETTIQQEPQNGQPRDESGRFAPKPGDLPPVTDNAPAAVEQPAAAQELTEEHPATGGIPQARLKAEAEKRREAEADAAALRREIAELRGMVQARQPAPQPQQEKPPATLWDDPDAFLQSQLTPIQQQMFDQKAGFSKMLASDKHGADIVEAALQAALAAKDTPEGRILDEKLAKSIHPFDEMVQWHKQQASLARVGNDPDAWLNAEIEKRLSDPAFLAQAVERARTGAASNSNRSQPITSLPPSLSRLPAGGNQPQDNDASDSALFSHATR